MDDLISRQAAIDAVKNRWKKTRNYEGIGDDIAEECELYLKHVPSAQQEIVRCKDCKLFGNSEQLPSAQPEQTGKWINGHWDGDSNFHIDGRGNCWYVRECSNCHEEIQRKPTKYCPNCGCRMLKEGEA